jgi:hypothetical protein
MALRVCEQNAAHLCTHVECQPELSIPILGSQLFAPRCSNTLSFRWCFQFPADFSENGLVHFLVPARFLEPHK